MNNQIFHQIFFDNMKNKCCGDKIKKKTNYKIGNTKRARSGVKIFELGHNTVTPSTEHFMNQSLFFRK